MKIDDDDGQEVPKELTPACEKFMFDSIILSRLFVDEAMRSGVEYEDAVTLVQSLLSGVWKVIHKAVNDPR